VFKVWVICSSSSAWRQVTMETFGEGHLSPSWSFHAAGNYGNNCPCIHQFG